MTTAPHPTLTGHLPFFITPPGSTDVLMSIAAVVLVAAVLLAGVLFLHIHSLPERMAHKGQKLQFEIVAVLCLLALLTHTNALWVIALLLALVDLPDLTTPLNRIARASERLSGLPMLNEENLPDPLAEGPAHTSPAPAGAAARVSPPIPEQPATREDDRHA